MKNKQQQKLLQDICKKIGLNYADYCEGFNTAASSITYALDRIEPGEVKIFRDLDHRQVMQLKNGASLRSMSAFKINGAFYVSSDRSKLIIEKLKSRDKYGIYKLESGQSIFFFVDDKKDMVLVRQGCEQLGCDIVTARKSRIEVYKRKPEEERLNIGAIESYMREERKPGWLSVYPYRLWQLNLYSGYRVKEDGKTIDFDNIIKNIVD